MIKSKLDYKKFVEADRIALNKSNNVGNRLRQVFFPDYIWAFQKRLRKLEYYKNCRPDVVGKIMYGLHRIKFRKQSLFLGFSIPINTFGPGLAIVHYGTIIVSANAKIGKNCRIHACTNIGASGGSDKAPHLGDNIYIGPGAKIFGEIQLGDNIAIAANSSVNKSFMESNILLAGSPAKRIKEIDMRKIIPISANIEI
ncbi:serine O-acetyltransferase [Maribacter dokdonensis]|uniref:Serine acetyltransferase n=1 Tax=Maribacter dokdonensis TaxID=320912 RepID=A0A1H4QDW9_9FLAO|nr:serine acetyltransferase [Maribacter dokdonensis]SEC17710.1 serine O-acetyltransferase [Maribacter dokdonensis]